MEADKQPLMTMGLNWAKRLALAALGVFLIGCHSMPFSEYETFTPLPIAQRIMNNVNINWEVRDDVTDFCANARGMGKEQAFMTPPLACAIWDKVKKECTVVTGTASTHTALGHEVRHCFEGHFHH